MERTPLALCPLVQMLLKTHKGFTNHRGRAKLSAGIADSVVFQFDQAMYFVYVLLAGSIAFPVFMAASSIRVLSHNGKPRR